MSAHEKPAIIDEIAKHTRNREAIPSFTGYLFQFELALLHILEDGSHEDAFNDPRNGDKGSFFIEKIEDYLKYYSKGSNRFIKLAQVKFHTGYAGPSDYEEAILWLYYNYLLFNKYSKCSNEKIEFVIFHHDISPNNKEPNSIFTDGLTKNRGKSLENQDIVYKKICEEENTLGHTNLREAFIKVVSFKKTKDRKAIIESIQNHLVNRYSIHGEIYSDKEFVYGAALSLLMDKGINRDWVTIKTLDDGFITKGVNVNKKFYLYKIFTLIEEVIEGILHNVINSSNTTLFGNTQLSQEEVHIYKKILRKIDGYLRSKFYDERNRKSFLNTISVKSLPPEYEPYSSKEFELFLVNCDSIQEFIMKLTKIMFYHYKACKGNIILNLWFKMTPQMWFFLYPDESRINGAILGKTATDSLSTLGVLIQRFKAYEQKPGVWYIKIGEYGNQLRASKTLYYQHDITLIDTAPTPCYPEDVFYIQCLECLEIDKYNVTDKVKNIFTNHCVKGEVAHKL